MKLPRDLDGRTLAKRLGKVGYVVTRQVGSHIRLTHPGPPQRHLTIPAHDPLKLGTLAAILAEVADQIGLERDDLLRYLL